MDHSALHQLMADIRAFMHAPWDWTDPALGSYGRLMDYGVRSAANARRRDALRATLKDFGVSKVVDLPDDKVQAFRTACEKWEDWKC